MRTTATATRRSGQDWLAGLGTRFGPYAPTAIVAHEWGHHVQRLLGRPDTSIGSELQADCMAGMFLVSIEGTGPDGRTYVLAGSSLDEAVRTFFSLGDSDYSRSQWFDSDVHGTPQQRFLAFATGYTTGAGAIGEVIDVANGLDWCLDYDRFEPGVALAAGPYGLLLPPGRPHVIDGSAFRIPAGEDDPLPAERPRRGLAARPGLGADG